MEVVLVSRPLQAVAIHAVGRITTVQNVEQVVMVGTWGGSEGPERNEEWAIQAAEPTDGGRHRTASE